MNGAKEWHSYASGDWVDVDVDGDERKSRGFWR